MSELLQRLCLGLWKNMLPLHSETDGAVHRFRFNITTEVCFLRKYHIMK